VNARFVVFLAVFAAFANTACLRKDYPATGPAVSDVEILDAKAVDPEDLLEGLATASSPRFLFIWDGVVFDYEVYDEALLERDLERVQRYYRARGFYEASVTAARVIRVDEHHVRVQIRVDEGVPLQVGSWTADGMATVDFEAATAAVQAVTLRTGARFDETTYDQTKKALLEALANNGYAFATVTGQVTADLARHQADVRLTVTPGKKSVFGPVKIVGLTQIPERPVRANLRVREGKEYSNSELEDARSALVNLGVFSTVDVERDLSRPDSGIVPVTVIVREAPLRTLRMGGGMRLDVLEWSSNLTFGWEHRNFLGGMRKFKIEARPGVVLFPTRMDNFTPPTTLLPKNRVRAELRQPSFIEGRTTGFIAGEFNIYPVLYPDQPTNVIFGYEEVKGEVGLERAFFRHHFYVTPSYEWQANVPFAYAGSNELKTAYISYPELNFFIDFRDDPIEPHKGVFFSNDLQVAGHVFGGDASDVRVQPELRTYVPISKSVVLATRATIGLLFPENYGGSLKTPQSSGDGNGDAQFDQSRLRDQQLLLFRAFYSGGPTSNRGYAFRGVGPHGVLGALIPSTAACTVDNLSPNCLRPLGGLTLWEFSLEGRFPIAGPLRGVIFVDASDVDANTATISFKYPHVSPGFGLRYATPIGPIRFDLGYRLPYLQEIGSRDISSRKEGYPGEIFGLPIAINFALGEAF
jgi:outer membrane protein insertion porin family/translocation and assembly module TamA